MENETRNLPWWQCCIYLDLHLSVLCSYSLYRFYTDVPVSVISVSGNPVPDATVSDVPVSGISVSGISVSGIPVSDIPVFGISEPFFPP